MPRALAIVIGCVALGVASAPAEALYICDSQDDVTVPAPGLVGPEPVLYRIHVDGYPVAPIAFDGPDGPVPWTIRETSTVGRVTVTAIVVHAQRGWFRDRWVERARRGSWAAKTAVYEIGVAAPPPPPPRLIGIEDRIGPSCSMPGPIVGQTMRFWSPDTVAFRVRWRDGTSALVPAAHLSEWTWWRDDDASLPEEASIAFGGEFCYERPLEGRRPDEVVAVEALTTTGRALPLAARGDGPWRRWWGGAIGCALLIGAAGAWRARRRSVAMVRPG